MSVIIYHRCFFRGINLRANGLEVASRDHAQVVADAAARCHGFWPSQSSTSCLGIGVLWATSWSLEPTDDGGNDD